jgi:hypothetical protein
MKYSLNISNQYKNNVFYTEYLIKNLICANGHELVSNIEADFILISICDITEISYLINIRKAYPRKKIIVGGHVAIFFKLCAIFADYVNVGQGFEFFKCKNEDEIKSLECIYYNSKNSIIKPSTIIEWNKCQVVQLSKKRYSYLASTGCKNKCKFCLTSWTNKLQNNNSIRIKKAYELANNRKACLKLISNDGYDNSKVKENVKDMLLTDFIKIGKVNTSQVRLGLEFAKESNRKKYGKYFTNKQLLQAIIRAREENIVLQLFCISGIDTKQDWINLLSIIPEYLQLSPKLIFKFTNLEYQMFTPIHRERFDINIDNYLDYSFGKELYNLFTVTQKNFKTKPIKYPAWALYRSALSHCTNINEFNFVYNYRNCKDINIMKRVYDKVIANDYSNMIQFWYQK